MKKTLILVIIFLSLSCTSHKGFREITNISVESSPKKDVSFKLDTLNSRVKEIWKKLSRDEKKNFKLEYKESSITRQKDIDADTSKTTKIYLSGNENRIIFKGKNRTKFTNLDRQYKGVDFHFESMDSIYKRVEIGKLDRYSGNHKVEIFFLDSRAYAILDLNTEYSSIHIQVSSIKKIGESESLKNRFGKEKGSISQIPERIEIVTEEGIHIYYEIPNRNHN